ncbi:MAG: 2-oxo acid dehydrogenase subunit E2 [Erysipelotrichaceae bacterium]|nr:2-oxo acid dehydrogenase subunit E2 [Erysipelotrichaceae bacterium]MBQ5805358.1 2-oxo acid dehydrogenase subunit E2 [Erysipelotrichaceae bacterium]
MRDRFDATYLKDLDSMHFIMPFMFPNRCDNQAYFTFQVDLTNLEKYLKKKNKGNPDYKYNMYQCIVTAVLKTITLRSKLSLFIHNRKMYRRNEVSAAFTVKQEFKDDGGEVLAFIHSKPEWTIDDVHNELKRQLLKLKNKSYVDESTGFMDKFNKLPKFISRPALSFVCWLEKKGMIPKALVETDPYHSSCVLANLGSIGLPDGYHHLTNWGTTSMFVVVGQSGRMPFYKNDKIEFRDGVRLGFTIDERIADGYYFSKSIKIMQLLLEEPELLERPLNEKLSDEMWQRINMK